MEITDDTTYAEIAEYLIKTDPTGVSDLVFILLETVPGLIKEVLSWEITQVAKQ